MIDSLSIIAGTSLFKGLPQPDLEELDRITVTKTFAKGNLIFMDGDAAEGFYIVAEGQIKVFKVSGNGKEQILHILGPGEPFAEVPVFNRSAYPASAEAIAPSRLLFFKKEPFLDLICGRPFLALNMLALLAGRLREFTLQIETLSLKEVPARIADYFLVLAREQGHSDTITLDISKGQLASLLGTVPETLSRIFAKMNAQGTIRVDGRRIRILDRPALEEMSASGKL